MGTRSTVKFYCEHNQKPILCVYQQFDGYIEGAGHTLANFLKEKKMINGINSETMEEGYANGMGCLAAQYVAFSKNEIGGFYLTDEDDSQDYNYHVKLVDNELIIEVDDFKGSPLQLLSYNG